MAYTVLLKRSAEKELDALPIRVGDYRVLYVIDEREKEVEIYSVAHRKDVYR